MITTFVPTPSTDMTLLELIAKLDSSSGLERLSCSDYRSADVEEIGRWLSAVARERKSVIAQIYKELERKKEFQKSNYSQPPIYVLHRGKNYIIRLLLWVPELTIGEEKTSFTYERAHDHAFDLVTIGFYGPGYTTRIYEHSLQEADTQPETDISLKFAQELTLNEGRIIYYAAHSDVHSQHEPESFSASLNILIEKQGAKKKRQTVFEFKLEKDICCGDMVLSRPYYNSVRGLASQRSVFALLASIGDSSSENIILRLARHHPEEEVRAVAWAGILRQEKFYHYLEHALSDTSSYVRSIAKELSDYRVITS